MSATDTTAPVLTMTRTGQANSTGDSSALMLKVYAGEVLTAFEQASVTQDKHVIRSLSSGISAQFKKWTLYMATCIEELCEFSGHPYRTILSQA